MCSARQGERVESFVALAPREAKVLILGSMPGAASLAAGRYYAHPRNQFWPLMGDLFGAGPDLDYPARLARLAECGIALWDVLRSCERSGSLDAAIRRASCEANDFPGLFTRCPGITDLLFNGATAAKSFERLVKPALVDRPLCLHRLPSTSPAHAGMGFEVKKALWREAFVAAGILA
ncbi:DNA-deoxyinosine glycosylase [Niveibacterium terrae]|uniref:DNA-deoxyinosine glycosylase n=1 Tax=Niveibacterium terrae TaxID=3373598 RepID=UPI003A956962